MLFYSHHSATIWPRPPTCRAWTRGRQLYPEPATVIHSSIAEGLCWQNKRGKKTQHDATWRGRIHVLKMFIVRRWCTVPSPLTWPSTKKSDGSKEFATIDSMDGGNVLPETPFVGTRFAWTPHGLYLWRVPSPLGKLPVRGQSLTSNRH